MNMFIRDSEGTDLVLSQDSNEFTTCKDDQEATLCALNKFVNWRIKIFVHANTPTNFIGKNIVYVQPTFEYTVDGTTQTYQLSEAEIKAQGFTLNVNVDVDSTNCIGTSFTSFEHNYQNAGYVTGLLSPTIRVKDYM